MPLEMQMSDPLSAQIHKNERATCQALDAYLKGLHTKTLGQVREVPQLNGEVCGAAR